ncbi:SLBB domain-containing protein [candidate division KSB1 bacterium]|nr:SLBB domain-containing protein [candidate division KSB1 bacterium]
MKKCFQGYCILLFFMVLPEFNVSAQEDGDQRSQYLVGEQQKLEMVVHIWGEVMKPGEYRVPYDTNVLELISKAGGPTEYANLSKVRLTREAEAMNVTQNVLKSLVSDARAGKITEEKLDESLKEHYASRLHMYNVTKYLKDEKGFNPPIELKPGDVVTVGHNKWYYWREVVRISHEVAVIASVYVWYLRAEKW